MNRPPDQPPPMTVCIALDGKFKRWSGDPIRGAGAAGTARVLDGGKWAQTWTGSVRAEQSDLRRIVIDFVLAKELPIVMDTLEFVAYRQGGEPITGTTKVTSQPRRSRRHWMLQAVVLTPTGNVKPFAYTLAADYRLPFTQGEPRRLALPYRNAPHPSFA